jgi:DNA polymerase-3 subunit gamma/tau
MVGQQHIIQTLQNSLKEHRISHAYLFSGPRGTGKTSAAKILAKAVNCERGPAEEPCNECAACRRITEGSIMDVVEIDAASNRGVDEIRDLRDKVRFAPTEVRRKVYIIDEVHMLTTEAFNALLKTLEEPPPHVMFILATTEPHKLPATIVSRCQRFDFRRVPLVEQVARLEYICAEENLQAEPMALQYIARLSDGGMRDALSLLDQISAYSDERITCDDVLTITGGVAADQFERLAQAIRAANIGQVMEVIDGWMQQGKSADRCLESLMLYFRDLLLVKTIPDDAFLSDRLAEVGRLKGFAEQFTADEMIRMIGILNTYQSEMKYSAQPQTIFEVAVIKLCSAQAPESQAAASDRTERQDPALLSQMKQKLERLEEQMAKLSRETASLANRPGAPEVPVLGAVSQPVIAGSAGSSPAPATSHSPFARIPAAMGKSGMKFDAFVRENSEPVLKAVTTKWNQVLNRVKDQKITVHAWLVDGEPVAVRDQVVLVAFKSAMHKETTEKPANKQLIEQVLGELFEQPLKLATVMFKDWKDATERAPAQQAEVLQPAAEVPEEENHPQEWIREAIKLFGEDLVTIKETQGE